MSISMVLFTRILSLVLYPELIHSMGFKKIHLSLICCLISFANLIAQDTPIRLELFSKDYSVFQWTTENGLPQNNIKQIIEGPNGYLWLSTYNGIARFDGYEFKIYNEGNTKELTSSGILKIVKDKDGFLWFSTTKEIIKIEGTKFKRYDLVGGGYNELTILNNQLHVSLKNKLYSFDNGDSKLVYSTVSNTRIYAYEIDGDIYIKKDDGIYLFANGKTKVISLKSNLLRIKDDIFCQLGQERPVYYQINKRKSQIIDLESLQIAESQSYDSDILTKLTHSTYGNSIAQLSNDKLIIQKAGKTHTSIDNTELNTKKVLDVYFAENGMIWMGTFDQGLILLYPKLFKSLLSEYDQISGTGSFIYEAKDSTLWIDLECGKVMNIDNSRKLTRESDIGPYCPWGMLIDKQNETWIVDLQRGVFKSYSELTLVPGKLAPNTNVFYSIYETKKGRKYVGTNTGIYELVNDSLIYLSNTSNLEHVYVFYEDREDNLLFCSKSGLGFLEDNHDFVIIDKGSGLPTNDVRSVYQDANKNYWIGTSMHGLYMYDNQNFYSLPYYDKRLGQDVLCIIEDKLGNLWMNSNNGIYRANRAELINYAYSPKSTFSTMRFTTADGLNSSEGNSRTQNKAFTGSDGNLWFSMITGPVYINPNEIDRVKESRSIQIDEVKIDKQLTVLDSIIKIKPNQNIIQVEFSHPNFIRSEHILYAYRIKELDGNWIEIDRSRVITLSELPFGNYTLTIKQVGTSNMLEIPIYVETFFWEKDIFKFSIVFILTALFFVSLFYLFRLRKRGIRKIRRMDADLNNLKLKALQTQMNPHFIFNCLNSIQSLYILNEHKKANNYMTRFSKLLRIIIEHAQKPRISLQEEIEMFDIYIPLEELQFEEEFDYNISVDPTIDLKNTLIPSMVTQTFIENSIKHGLKTLKSRKGELNISISKYKESILIEIMDNGVGYNKAMQLKKELEVSHTSRGTDITKQRIELINTLNEIDIQIQTTHLKDENGNSLGTKVGLYFPKTII